MHWEFRGNYATNISCAPEAFAPPNLRFATSAAPNTVNSVQIAAASLREVSSIRSAFVAMKSVSTAAPASWFPAA